MSDDFITFVSTDPRFVPSEIRIFEALDLARRLFPTADAIEEERSSGIRFFDAGANFEAVFCPSCSRQISVNWLSAAMDADYGEAGFQLQTVSLPCCGAECTLADLRYEWPQAFGRFGLRIMNAAVGRIKPELLKELETALGTRLRVVYQHI